jgi:hypothetical protein
MGDLMASGTNPGTTYTITALDPGVYHEDRVLVTEVAPSTYMTQMFRVYGAQFTGTFWQYQSGVSTAYATVQNPDGSIHYFTYSGTNNWSTSAWQGSDNNTVYNAVDFGATAGGSALDNTNALASLFTVMNAPAGNQGGYARIPQLQFSVNASPSGSPLAVPPGVIMQGLGTGGKSEGGEAYYHFSISDPAEAGPYTFFYVNASHTSGGTFFNNIAFDWLTPGYALDTCIFFSIWNGGVYGCTFQNCPTAINIQGLGVSVKNCTITYGQDITTPTAVTAIVLGGQAINCEISGPSEFNGHSVGGNSTCIVIGAAVSPSACNLNRISGLHITGWTYGIDYSNINGATNGSNSQFNVIEGCHIDASNTCVNLQPSSSSGLIFDQKFIGNTFFKSQNSANDAPIVFIDSNNGTATNIDEISFIDNLIFSDVTESQGGTAYSNQYGVMIGTCAAVSIVGGRISQCGTTDGSDGTANICISGNPTSVTVTSVNLNGVYPGANSGSSTGTSGSAASEYALLISGDPQIVKVTDCFMSGTSGYSVSITGSPETVRLTDCTFGESALSVTGTPTSLIVTNCTGYNDQSTVIASGVSTGDYPTSSTGNTAATAGALTGGVNYYGASLVIFTAGASPLTVHINGVASTYPGLSSGTVFLNSPYDVFYFGAAPGHFEWIGK